GRAVLRRTRGRNRRLGGGRGFEQRGAKPDGGQGGQVSYPHLHPPISRLWRLAGQIRRDTALHVLVRLPAGQSACVPGLIPPRRLSVSGLLYRTGPSFVSRRARERLDIALRGYVNIVCPLLSCGWKPGPSACLDDKPAGSACY